MTKKLLLTLSSTTLLIIAVCSFNLLINTTPQTTTETERVEYEKFINEHDFSQIRYTQEEIKGIPKRDRPDLAMQQDYMATMNPATGRPEKEKLFPVLSMTKIMQQNLQSSAPGNTGSPWVERGPDNVGGRTRALAWDPTTTNKVWAGSVTGGLWYNNNITSAASSWQSVNDFWDNIAVTAIAFDPNTPATIYIGTGEGWGGGGTSSRGAGVWKSTNGGTSFVQIASSAGFYYIHDLVVRNEGGASVVYAAVARQFYQGQFHGTGEGIQRSTNGGTSWTNVLTDGTYTPTDIDISGNNTLFVGTDGGKIFSSTNGTTFILRHNNGSAGRVNLACAPSDANYIYAAFEVGSQLGAFKQSTNGGGTWTTRSEPNDADGGIPATDFTRNQAWYDLTLDVDPNNRDIVMIGGIDIFRTANGGGAWSQSTHWYGGFGHQEVHADQHAIVYKPGSSTEVIFGNDGGVFYTSNGTTTTPTINSRINGYNVTQYYACAIHPTAGTNNFLAGAQDNGTQRYLSAGINSTTEATGGDGAFCFIDQTNGQYQFSSYVYNSWRRSTNSGASFSNIQDDQSTGKFINPGDYDNNQDVLYSARSTSTIQRITSATGGYSISNFTIAGLGSIASHLSVSPYTTTSTTLFVGTGGGRVFRVTNAQGASISTEITGGSFPTGNVSCIAIGATENELLVTFSNYGVNSIWYSSNGGTSWVSKEGDLSDMPVRWALFNPNDYNEVIVATEVGVWTTTGLNAGSPNWTTSNSGLANVRVDMLQMRTSDNEVLAATHGRGLFSSDGFNGTIAFTADFSANNTTPTINSTVTFTDLSVPSPTGWTWTFSPATVTYQGGTNATSKNPQVSFNNPGAYTVTLASTDGTSNDTEIKTSYINAVDFVADFSASNIAPSTVETVTLTDATTPVATGWTWTFAPATVTFQGGTNANSQNPQVTFDNAGTYTVTLVATDANNSDTEIKTTYINASIGYCTASSTATNFEHITNVTFNTINNTTVSSGYADYTNLTTTIIKGTSYNLNVTYTDAYATNEVKVWVDFNQNLDFSDPGEEFTFPAGAGTGSPYTLSIPIPIGAVIGSTTMRVRLHDPAFNPEPLPCGDSGSGEVEDYTVNIVNPSYCDGASTATNWEHITNVTFNTINNTSLSSGYFDYTSISTIITKGNSYNFDVTYTDAYTTNVVKVWIDFNQNFVFTDPGEEFTFPAGAGTGSPYTLAIPIPVTALTGPTRMRVRLHDPAFTPQPLPCGDSGSGEVEDYTVNIVPPSLITWTNQPANTTISCDASSLPANTGTATATTTCVGAGLSVTSSDAIAAGSCANASVITRTWTATDNCANSETFDQIITIQDITNPTITCPVNQTQPASNGVNTTLNSYTTMAIVGDNCSSNANITVTQSPAIGSTQNVGTVNVTLTATDECGNTSNCNFDVIITNASSITWTNQPANATISCDASSLPANTGITNATSTCIAAGGVTISSSDATTAGSCANASVITRTWTATDNCGNTETFNQTIAIQDITNPTITCPANQTQIASNGINTPISSYTTMATVSDNCSSNANITITQSPTIGSIQNAGTVNVSLTATDECGNTSSCNFDVVISAGATAITWTNQPADIIIDCDASNLPVNTGTATATTTCGIGLNVSSTDISATGSCANEYIITRTWIATDNCSNTETFDQIITVQDTTKPVIFCPASQTQIASNGTDTVLLDYTTMATISDNCSSNANITVTQSPAIGSTQAIGIVNVTLTATDECGNTSDCTFDVDITSTVGIADNTRVNISIFPNPNKGLFTIDLGTEMNGDVTIQVYNLLGEVVYNEYKKDSNTAYKLNLQHVDKGIYYVSIKSEKSFITKKIMIM
tara:strand:- start:603 stop:6143 length:5541 start_codon:yes stop_codon:yes gene_type:complete